MFYWGIYPYPYVKIIIVLADRMFDRVLTKDFIVLDGTTKFNTQLRETNWNKHLETAFEAGLTL